MTRLVIRFGCVLIGFIAPVIAVAAVAETPRESQSAAYERGIQAYFAEDFAAASPLFAAAMNEDPQDPRPYYFHALCSLHEGRRSAARSDVLAGAAREARSHGRYSVGASLERVQGADRLALEQYRWLTPRAGTPSSNDAANSAVQSADFEVRTDAAVLRRKVSVPLDRLVQPVSLAEIAAVSEEKIGSTVEPAATGSPAAKQCACRRRVARQSVCRRLAARTKRQDPVGKAAGDPRPVRWRGQLPYLLTRYVNRHRNCRLPRRRARCQPRRPAPVRTRHSHLPKTTRSRNLPRTQAVREMATAPNHPRNKIRSNSDATFNLCLW